MPGSSTCCEAKPKDFIKDLKSRRKAWKIGGLQKHRLWQRATSRRQVEPLGASIPPAGPLWWAAFQWRWTQAESKKTLPSFQRWSAVSYTLYGSGTCRALYKADCERLHKTLGASGGTRTSALKVFIFLNQNWRRTTTKSHIKRYFTIAAILQSDSYLRIR